ncbi:MAG: LacI family DNA-binding transcriptional regulator [Herpetosiphonaceae bacterium]|nr:LacI family DNA-binding transcriptional regulator [Herpetosiphonaceae bacterium]
MTNSLKIEEIAALAQVSAATVSRVLNNYPHVRPALRERVLQVIKDNNYTPHAAARSLASSRTKIIGLLIPRSAVVVFADPYFPRIIQGITEACNRLGYYLMLSMVSSTVEETFYKNLLRGRHFDGVLTLASDIDDPILPVVIKQNIPLVMVGNHPYFTNIISVDVDNRQGACIAVQHLIDSGNEVIATITGPLNTMVGLERRDGFKQALLQNGRSVVPELILEGDFTQESGYQAMQRLLDHTTRPNAVFVANDTMAIGAMRAIHDADLRVPDDVSLASFDNLPVASYVSPALTSVNQPMFETGDVAAQILISMIEGTMPVSARTLLPTNLVVRQSSGAGSRNAGGAAD